MGRLPIFLYHKIKDGSYKNTKMNKLSPPKYAYTAGSNYGYV